MSENHYIYAKFPKSGEGIDQYIITTDYDKAKSWIAQKESKKEKPKPKESLKQAGEPIKDFHSISEDVFKTFISYYDLMPILISIAQVYPFHLMNSELKGIFQKKGNLIDVAQESDFDFYKTDISNSHAISAAIRKMESFQSISSDFSRFFIMGLISSYDYFIYQIAQKIISEKPHIVFNKDASINFFELEQLTDIDGAKKVLIDKTIEGLLRSSHEEQLKWLSEKLEIKIEPEEKLLSRFIELCERRNLFAHCGGIVSKHYIEQSKKFKFTDKVPKLGTKLNANRAYFQESVDTIIEMAFQIVAVSANKITPEFGKEISQAVTDVTYSLIEEKRYSLAISLINFLLKNRSFKMSEDVRKRHVINCANAMKLSGSMDYQNLIQGEDWTACSIEFVICKNAVMEDFKLVITDMRAAADSKRISKNHFREWPVFQSISSNEEFRAEFENIFSEPFIFETS